MQIQTLVDVFLPVCAFFVVVVVVVVCLFVFLCFSFSSPFVDPPLPVWSNMALCNTTPSRSDFHDCVKQAVSSVVCKEKLS